MVDGDQAHHAYHIRITFTHALRITYLHVCVSEAYQSVSNHMYHTAYHDRICTVSWFAYQGVSERFLSWVCISAYQCCITLGCEGRVYHDAYHCCITTYHKCGCITNVSYTYHSVSAIVYHTPGVRFCVVRYHSVSQRIIAYHVFTFGRLVIQVIRCDTIMIQSLIQTKILSKYLEDAPPLYRSVS